jgi:hypothetical protein
MLELKINKYSKKCINNVGKKLIYKLNTFNHPLLLLFDEIFNETIKINNDIKIIKEKFLRKLHSTKEYPLIYLHYLESTKTNLLSFKEFYNYYTENHSEISKLLENKTRVIEVIKSPMKDRHKLHDNIYDNNFISIDIQHIIETNDMKFKEIQLNNNKISLYEFDKKPNLDLIFFIINFMENLAKKFNIKYNPIDLTLILTSQKKLITNKKFLGPENINSGSTYFNNSVLIWRIEEVYKVLIHELIHFFGFDHSLFMNSLSNNGTNKHCINGDDRENEAYTESFALSIHTFILSKFLKVPFFDLFNYEINFSLIQCKKILDFFKIDNIKDIIFNKNCDNPIYQKTGVFSYFFIKTSLILNLKNTMDFIYKNSKNISEFNKLIEKSLESEEINIVNNIKIPDNESFFNNTMRMTCLEFS